MVPPGRRLLKSEAAIISISFILLLYTILLFYSFFIFISLEMPYTQKNHKNFPLFEFLILENGLNELAKSQFRSGDYRPKEYILHTMQGNDRSRHMGS